MLAPEPTEVHPVAVHYHYWRLVIYLDGGVDSFPLPSRLGKNVHIKAECECGARLTQEQIEAILNGHQLEAQYG